MKFSCIVEKCLFVDNILALSPAGGPVSGEGIGCLEGDHSLARDLNCEVARALGRNQTAHENLAS